MFTISFEWVTLIGALIVDYYDYVGELLLSRCPFYLLLVNKMN